MNNIYLQDHKSIRSINFIYFLLALPLLIFGFYKNGIVVFINENTNILGLFKPLIIPIIFYYLIYFIVYLKHKKKNVSEYSLLPNYGLFIGMCLPPQVNILLSLVIFIVISFIYIFLLDKKISINYMALCLLIIIIINKVVLNISYNDLFLNNYEINTNLKYSLSSNIIGFNYSGIASSSIILCCLSLILLSIFSIYKIEIPIYCLITYIFIFILLKVFGLNVSYMNLINYSSIFIIGIFATEMKNTPVTLSGKVTYGILLGLLIWCFSFLNMALALLISIIICSIISPILNIIFRKT